MVLRIETSRGPAPLDEIIGFARTEAIRLRADTLPDTVGDCTYFIETHTQLFFPTQTGLFHAAVVEKPCPSCDGRGDHAKRIAVDDYINTDECGECDGAGKIREWCGAPVILDEDTHCTFCHKDVDIKELSNSPEVQS